MSIELRGRWRHRHLGGREDHQVPFPFTGKLDKLTVKLGPEELTPDERMMIYGAQQTTK